MRQEDEIGDAGAAFRGAEVPATLKSQSATPRLKRPCLDMGETDGQEPDCHRCGHHNHFCNFLQFWPP